MNGDDVMASPYPRRLAAVTLIQLGSLPIFAAGPPAMTGKGEITFQGTVAYTGTIRYVTDEGNMTINLTGRKIGGCDNPS